MYAEIESTIPINLIRPGRRTDGLTPPPNLDVEFFIHVGPGSEANFYAGLLDEEPTGVFVPTYRQHPLGTLVAVAIDLPGRDDLLIVNTLVRWVREPCEGSGVPPGLGLEFLHVNDKARAQLRRFASRRSPLLFDD